MLVKVESDFIDGDAIVPLPDDILLELGWEEGDTLNIRVEDGQIILEKTDALEKTNDNEL